MKNALRHRSSFFRQRLRWFKRGILILMTIVYLSADFSSRVSAQGEEAAVGRRPSNAQPPQGGPPPGAPPNGSNPGQPNAGQPAPGQPGAAPAAGAPAEGQPATPVLRPSSPPEPPDRKEFDIKLDEDGKIQFNFRNQPWPDLLNWLGKISNMSLDWQQLPGDFINLATTRPYSIEETRDLVNRLLLLRGYTMLEVGDNLIVTKTEGINTALVPYVDNKALDSLPPNRFVKTSFQLSFLLAEEIAEEIKDLKSSNGKITPLSTTNRLEIMDAAIVLRGISKLLDEEQSLSVREQLAREFALKYVRASEVKEQIEAFLGKQQSRASSGPSDPMQMQMQMQMQQQMQQMQQQMAQQQAAAGGGGAKKSQRPSDVYLVANNRQNSVIVHAPPNKMAIIAAFIDRVDVPSETADDLQSMLNRVKVYRLSSLPPQQLVTSLLAMDALEPTTKIEVDEKNKSITVNASLADHFTIAQIIKKLDGSAREFEVLQLRRLDAEEVAGTVRFLMGVDQEEEQENNNDYYYYNPFRNRNNQDKAKPDKFRIGANSRDNQLLIWANDSEREEINKLLIKLGEIPPAGGFASKLRVLDADRSPETLEYLKRLQESWSQISDTPLILPDPSQLEKPAETKPEDDKDGEQKKPEKAPESNAETNKDITHASTPKPKLVAAPKTDEPKAEDISSETASPVSGDQEEDENKQQTATAAPVKKSPAITIEFDESGNLILRGDDPKALDKLEEFMLQKPPPRKPFAKFDIKHTRASWIVLNLKDFFKDAESEDDGPNRRSVYYFYESYGNNDKKKEDRQLSGSKKPLKFVDDNDTNTVIVRNASADQLELIAELIKEWDTPTKTTDKDLRYTELVKVQYSKADAIVEAIKDAYRDLLSSNDKAFQQAPPGGGGGEEKRDNNDDVVRNGAVNFTFEGKLSLGVDRVTNSVLVSAQGKSLLQLIVKMVKQLDDAAKPSGATTIVHMPGATTDSMQKALKAMFGKPEVQNQQQQPNGQPQPNQQPPQNNEAPQAGGKRNRRG